MKGGTRRSRRVAVIVAAAVAVTGAAATVAATGFGLPDAEGTGGDGADLPPATAAVTRQTLVDLRKETGELGYGDATAVADRLGGTLTGLAQVAATVQRGQVLYRIDNTPVVLLYGPLPAYRALAAGSKGADVKQFEQNLRALGYRGFTVDQSYTAATASAVKTWQRDLGLARTGVVELGRVVYAPGAVRVDSHGAKPGDICGPGTDVLTYTGNTRVVTVDLDVADQRLATVGAEVTVTLPDGTTVPGKITKTRTIIKTAEGNQPADTKIRTTVRVEDEKTLSGLDQASVAVGFTGSQADNVLTVPVAALLALAEGGYGVQLVEGGGTRIVAVETGLFAQGRVEVSGAGLKEGMLVGMPS